MPDRCIYVFISILIPLYSNCCSMLFTAKGCKQGVRHQATVRDNEVPAVANGYFIGLRSLNYMQQNVGKVASTGIWGLTLNCYIQLFLP